eukprot:51022-Ditylum_brightwellii.AAC.2
MEVASMFLFVTATVVPSMGRILQMMSQSVLGGITQVAATDLKKKALSKTTMSSSAGKNTAPVCSVIGFGVAVGAALGGRFTKLDQLNH